ncbi:MAG: hypothetical protein Q9184_008014, partial [Pyrenodesmia sp. 2 TL-2023]
PLLPEHFSYPATDIGELLLWPDPYCGEFQSRVAAWHKDRELGIPATRPEMGTNVNCDICFHSSTGKHVRKNQLKYARSRGENWGTWSSNMAYNEYNFDFHCKDYGYMHGCDVLDVMNDDHFKLMSNSTPSGDT